MEATWVEAEREMLAREEASATAARQAAGREADTAKEAAEAAKEEADDNWGLDELQTPVDTPVETPIEARSEAQAPISNNPFFSLDNHTNEEVAKPEGQETTAKKGKGKTNEPVQKGGGKGKQILGLVLGSAANLTISICILRR